MSGQTAWLSTSAWALPNVPAPTDPFVLVEVLSATAQRCTVRGKGGDQTVPASALSPTSPGSVPDQVMLFNFSEATVLDNLIQRYRGGDPYTYTGEILTSVNPCRRIDSLYSADVLTSYAGKLLGSGPPPHLYAMAEEAYRLLLKTRSHQGMVISGVSGAGKTEANKIIMQYLCWRASHSAGKLGKKMRFSPDALAAAEQLATGGTEGLDDLPRKILNSNTIFEAFGNASTTNNDNSSRFGKFVRLLFDESGRVTSARVSTYLLEKSRLVLQCKDERNFHCLYQFLDGASNGDGPMMPEELRLEEASAFRYLNQSGRYTIDGVDDRADWAKLVESLSALGVTMMEQEGLMGILNGILHLGQLSFVGLQGAVTDDGSKLDVDDASVKKSLDALGYLWGLTAKGLEGGLTTRKSGSARGSTYSVGLTVAKATQTRDALAKAVYSSVFAWLSTKMNEHVGADISLGSDSSLRWIGLLDAFGFELLQSNSFEQLLINSTNEYLQQYFLKCVMRAEQHLYESENLAWTPIAYKDNQTTISVLHDRPSGVMPMLDEESRKLAKGSDQAFAARAREALQENGHEQSHVKMEGGTARQEKARKAVKTLFSSGVPHFCVSHFAGEVAYEVVGWLDKNGDTLYDDLKRMLISSSKSLLATLFSSSAPHVLAAKAEQDLNEREKYEREVAEAEAAGAPAPAPPKPEGGGGGKGGKGGGARGNIVSSATICTRFSSELEALMSELNRSRVHFVRCLKPNEKLVPSSPDPVLLLDQLLFSGMLEAVELMRAMFPGRIAFVEIHRRFQGKLPESVMRMSPGDFVRSVVAALHIPEEDYQIGTSRLFFRTGGADFLRELQHADPDELVQLLRDPMMHWWSMHSMLPAAVLGKRARAEARARRAAVGTLSFYGGMWADKLRFRRQKIALINCIHRRRYILWVRADPSMRIPALFLSKAQRGKVGRQRVVELHSAAINLDAAVRPDARTIDLEYLAECIEVARRSKVQSTLIIAAEMKLKSIGEQREAAKAEMAKKGAAPIKLRDADALATAIEAARLAGVDGDAISAAEQILGETIDARDRAIAKMEALTTSATGSAEESPGARLVALHAAVGEAEDVGVAPCNALDVARGQLEGLQGLREQAAAQLAFAVAPAAAQLDLDALEAALSIATLSGVDQAALEAARERIEQVSAAREAANAELANALETPTAALDLTQLQELINSAITVGVPAADVEAAEAVLERVTALREGAKSDLEASTAGSSKAVVVSGALKCLAAAGAAGVEDAALEAASVKLKRVVKQRNTATTELKSAMGSKMCDINLNALGIAIETAEDAGCDDDDGAEAAMAAAASGGIGGNGGGGRTPQNSVDVSDGSVDSKKHTRLSVGGGSLRLSLNYLKRRSSIDAKAAARQSGGSDSNGGGGEEEAGVTATMAAKEILAERQRWKPKLDDARELHGSLGRRRPAVKQLLGELGSMADGDIVLATLCSAIEEAIEVGIGDRAPLDAAEALQERLFNARRPGEVLLASAGRALNPSVSKIRQAKAAIMLQGALRRACLTELMGALLLASRMMATGNVFVKFSQNGPPHDRWVWLEDNTMLRWADPEKKKKGQLKGAEATILLSEINAISEGIKSELGKHHKTSMLQSLRGFKASTSGIKNLDQDCCLTILSKQRSLDMQAPSKLVAQEWLLSLRLMLTARATEPMLATIADRAKLRELIRASRTKKGGGFFGGGGGGAARVWNNFFSGKGSKKAKGAPAIDGGDALSAPPPPLPPRADEAGGTKQDGEDDDEDVEVLSGAEDDDDDAELQHAAPPMKGIGLGRAASGAI